jgi:hypothetical protein
MTEIKGRRDLEAGHEMTARRKAKYALQAGYVPRFEMLGLVNLLYLQTKIMAAEKSVKDNFVISSQDEDLGLILDRILINGPDQGLEFENLMKDLQKYSAYHHRMSYCFELFLTLV